MTVKRKIRISLIAFAAALALLPAAFAPVGARAAEETDGTVIPGVLQGGRSDSYAAYLEACAEVPFGTAEIAAGPGDLAGIADGEVEEDWKGTGRQAVSVAESGWMEFTVEVPEEGLYNIAVDYYPELTSGTTIEFESAIDGKLPFYECAYFMFYSVWKDLAPAGEAKDANGNDLIPGQEETPQWLSGYLRDLNGVYAQPYFFHFTKGRHIIRFTSTREALTIAGIRLTVSGGILKPYADVREEYEQKGYKPAESPMITLEAEHPQTKSDSSLYAHSDRTSPDTTPYSPAKVRLNILGGMSFSSPGQWVEYAFRVEKAGLYKFGMRARQSFLSGSYVSRNIYIDGTIPFQEFSDIRIPYSMNWQNILPDYEVYLDEGPHTLRIEVTVGTLSEIIARVEDSVYQLNRAYRSIIMITGTVPDPYRDYKLDYVIPEVFGIFKDQAEVLRSCDLQLLALTGRRGGMNGILQAFAKQMESFCAKPETVQLRLGSFKDKIGSLGDWLIDIKRQPLEIDRFYVYSSVAGGPPAANSGMLRQLRHVLLSFIASFTEDYNSIGGTGGTGRPIEVWVQTGRDQANILRSLISNYFTPDKGIDVTLKLVQGQLLAATAAGVGPDVALQVGAAEPVNYALRGAVADLRQFGDLDGVLARFRESAVVPFEFAGGIYALPETQTYPVLFYRSDVFGELGLEVPTTWEELFHVVGILQKSSMTMGIRAPSSIVGSSDGLSSMAMFLYQRGGTFYTDGDRRSGLSSEAAIAAFKTWISLYQDYSIPLAYNAAYRFRTGEMPLLIEDFTLYNMLSVTAPEIRGMWGIAAVPGTVKEDGTIDRTVAGTGIACMMMNASSDKEAAWEFLKWWTSEDAQLAFAKDIETQLGISARYPTANVAAFAKLPWSADEFRLLSGEFANVRAIPQIAGGYFTSRHLNNAFRRVITYKEDPRRVLLEYTKNIDDEIASKRSELGLD